MKRVLFAFLLALPAVPSAAAAERATVAAINGNVVLNLNGKSMQLTSSGMDLDPVLSPNGAMVVFTRKVEQVPKVACDMGTLEKREMWLIFVNKKGARKLLETKVAAEPKDSLCDFQNKQFSSDNRKVLFETPAWVTSGALHEIDLTTGAQRYVMPSNGFRVLTDCAMREYRDHVVVNQHRYFVFGGSYDWYWLYSSDAKRELGAIGENIAPIEEACDVDLENLGARANQ